MGGSSGGGGGVQNVQTTVTNTNIPQEFYPYLQKSLQQADALLQQDYIPYEGQRVAAYTPEQQAAFQGITGLASRSLPGIDDARSFTANQLVDPATGLPRGASVTDATTSYTAPTTGPTTFSPGTVSSTYTAPASFASNYTGREITSGYQPGTIGTSYQGREIASTYNPGTITTGYNPQAITSTYNPQTITSQFKGANVGTDYRGREFTRPDLASRIADFQNPFQQQVLDVAQERAERAFNTQQAQRGLQATRAGGASAFGARGTLANLEAERAFRDRQAATEADLLLKGFDKATATALADIDRGIRTQQLTDASRRAAAGLGLQGQIATGRFAQAAGAQGLQAQQLTDAARRAAGVQNLQAQQLTDAGLRALGAQGLQAAQLTDAAQRAAGAQDLQAAQLSDAASRAAGAQGLQAAIASDAARRASGAQGLQAAQLSDASSRAAGEQALRALFAADSSAQKAGEQALRAALASEDLKARGGEQAIRAFSALEQAGQAAGAQGLQAAIANQRALAQEKARLDTLARFGINVDAQEQALDLQRIGALQAAGADLRADQQRILDADYQDFLRQRDFPRDQLQFYSNILRGAQSGPMDRTVAQAQPPANQAGQLFNFLLGAAALNRAA